MKPSEHYFQQQQQGAERGRDYLDRLRLDQQAAKPAQESQPKIVYRRISDIEAKPIRWLWPGRIARGKVSMIAGHPGLGKSQITASLAAIATTGGLWPVDCVACELGSVLFLSAEDDPSDTIRPRLEAAGADLSRVHVLEAVHDGYNADGTDQHRAFNLRKDILRLEKALTEIGNVCLVVIDPVSAYLGSTESHNNAEVRALLAPLAEMAARAGVAIVAVSHLNKGGGGDALARVTGSLAFVAAARAAYIVAKDPDDEARRVLLPAKNNIGKDIGGLAFRIEPVTTEGGIETSRVLWEPVPVSGMSADEVLRTPSDEVGKEEADDCQDWLRSVLSGGAVDAVEVFKMGERNGYQRRTVQRARGRIGAKTAREGFGPGSKVVWFLAPIDDTNSIDDSHHGLSPMGGSVTYGDETKDGEVVL